MKKIYSLLLIPVLLAGCATTGGTLESDAVAALSAIQSSSTSLASSGAVPAGTPTNVVNDASTISNALETINTGTGITQAQATAIAASFKSNSSTTGYIQLAAAISDVVVPLVSNLIKQGQTPAQVQAATTQVLTNAPAAVQAGVVAASTSLWKPTPRVYAKATLRPPYGERDPFAVLLARK